MLLRKHQNELNSLSWGKNRLLPVNTTTSLQCMVINVTCIPVGTRFLAVLTHCWLLAVTCSLVWLTYFQIPFSILLVFLFQYINTNLLYFWLTYLNLGTTFQITQKRDSGEMAPFVPCHNAINVFLTSSINNLQSKKLKK